MKELVFERSLEEFCQLVISKSVPGRRSTKSPEKQTLKLSLLPCTSLCLCNTLPFFLVLCPGLQIQFGNQYYRISPKTSALHTHCLRFWKPNIYLGRSIPKSVSQNQVCVCEEWNNKVNYVLEPVFYYAMP